MLLDGELVFYAATVFHGGEWFLGFEDLEPEEQAGDDSGDAGYEQEEPDLGESLSADEESGAEAAGGVHADAGDVNAEDVDGDQRNADGEAGETGGRGFLRGSKDHDDEDEGGDEFKRDR